MTETPRGTVIDATQVVGWVDRAPMSSMALDEYRAALAGSALDARLGLTPGSGPGPTHSDDHRARALRSWSGRAMLLDRLATVEAARLGVTDLGSPDDWMGCLEAAGELDNHPPTRADALACYQANIYRYRYAEARLARHVLVAERAEAERLIAALSGPAGRPGAIGLTGPGPVGPGALADLARAVSLDSGSGRSGGDLGWVERGQLSGELERAIFDAVPGRLCGPVHSHFGWHLLVVEAVRPERVAPFAECCDQILVEMADDRRQTAWRQWWQRRAAEAITVPVGSEQMLVPGLPGTTHRH